MRNTIWLALSVLSAIAVLVGSLRELSDPEKTRLKTIAIDFGFGATAVDCSAKISDDSVRCVQQNHQKWDTTETANDRRRVCCEKWDEQDCLLSAAAEKCDYNGFYALRESQLLIRQLLEADACGQFRYGDEPCIQYTNKSNGKLGSIMMGINFYIVLIILLFFAFVYWLR